MSGHTQKPSGVRRSADQCQPAASQHPLSDPQLGGIRRHLNHVLSFSPIPIQQPDATHKVAHEWAKAILGLGGVLHHFGLADEVRRDRPAPADTWLPWSNLKTAELAHFVLCLAVDHAEGEETWRRARLADKVEHPRHPVPPAERERASKLITDARDGWIAEILANGALLTDDPTFRRFTDGLKRHVERLLPRPAEAAADGAPEQRVLVPDPPPLGKTGNAILSLLRKRLGRGMSGKEIISALKKKHISIELLSFQRHIVPKLKAHGVQNHRSRGGYYIDPPSTD
jgi:hypothetical protein